MSRPSGGSDPIVPRDLGSGQRRTLRRRLFKKQKGKCHWCNRKMSKQPFRKLRSGKQVVNWWYATFEHLTKVRDGGTMARNNIVLAHWRCNHMRETFDDIYDNTFGVEG